MSVIFQLTKPLRAYSVDEFGRYTNKDLFFAPSKERLPLQGTVLNIGCTLPSGTLFRFHRAEPHPEHDAPDDMKDILFYTIQADGQYWMLFTNDLDGAFEEVA